MENKIKNIAVTLLVVFSISSFNFAQNDDWLSIAIVRADGIIAPIYRFQNNEWQPILGNPNLFSFYESEIKSWVCTDYKDSSFVLSSGTLVKFDLDVEGYSGFGFLSNYNDAVTSRRSFPIPIVGFASNVDISISLFKNESTNSSLARKMLNRINTSQIKYENIQSVHPEIIKNYDKKKYPDAEITDIRTAKIDNIELIFVEAMEPFGAPYPSQVFFAQEIIFRDGSAEKSIFKKFGFSDIDFKIPSFQPLTPLSIFIIDSKIYIFFRCIEWESAYFEFYEIINEKLVKVGN